MQEKNSGALSTKTLSWIIKRNKKKYYDYKKTKLITKNIFSSFQRKNSSFYAKSLCDCSWRRAIQKQNEKRKKKWNYNSKWFLLLWFVSSDVNTFLTLFTKQLFWWRLDFFFYKKSLLFFSFGWTKVSTS